MKRFLGGTLCGILLGTLLLGTASANTTDVSAVPSWHQFFVDGRQVEMTAYNIGGNNYVKLRDIGEQVGFNVFWQDGVQVDSTAVYTGIAPEDNVVSEKTAVSEEEEPREQEEHAQIDLESERQKIVELTNEARKGKNLGSCNVDKLLMEAAQVRAEEMAATSRYEHTRPDGSRFYTVTDCEYMAENIHRISTRRLEQKQVGLAELATDEWLDSEGHKANMMNGKMGAMGVGLAKGLNASGEEAWYCVQLFLYDGQSVTWVDEPVLN